MGIVPPKFVIERVLVQMRAFIAVAARDNILYANLRDKLGKLGSVAPAERARLLGEAQAAIERNVYPAYRRLIEFFADLQPKVTEDYGVWKLPGGDGFYDHLIRSHTTTSLNAEQIFNIGLSEVARIEKELDAATQHQGAAGAAVQEETAPGAYADTGSLDGSRPGVFYVNLRDMRDIWRYQLRTLTCHEAVPGHQLQGVVAQRLTDVPTFRKILPFSPARAELH
jgi:uncharacterized protein (DUF885 family)